VLDRFLLTRRSTCSTRPRLDPHEMDIHARRAGRDHPPRDAPRVEETALKKEKDNASKARLAELRKELAVVTVARRRLTARWLSEKKVLDETRTLREQLEAAKTAYELARARLRQQQGRRAQVRQDPRARKEAQGGGRPSSSPRTARSCCARRSPPRRSPRRFSRWAGNPVTKLLEGEREKLLHLPDVLHRRVVGQDDGG
jgi:ATP-dependent Clp protease ATP-binding subunit ClpB